MERKERGGEEGSKFDHKKKQKKNQKSTLPISKALFCPLEWMAKVW